MIGWTALILFALAAASYWLAGTMPTEPGTGGFDGLFKLIAYGLAGLAGLFCCLWIGTKL